MANCYSMRLATAPPTRPRPRSRTSSTANSLPSALTPNSNGSLATSMSYSSAFALTSVTGANGATQSTVYDVFNRPASATSVDGAVTQYSYTYATPGNPNSYTSQTATITTTVNNNPTNTQWKTTYFDGFGRPILVQTGYNGNPITQVSTQYGACGCSPLGKMTATSMPYAPGGTPVWTTYTYDTSGRTLTATKPGAVSAKLAFAKLYLLTSRPKAKRDPVPEKNQQLRRENQRLTEELSKAVIVIDIQKKWLRRWAARWRPAQGLRDTFTKAHHVDPVGRSLHDNEDRGAQ